mmetsp:Transcript_38758/g.74383  ORF Transcript_38758/g.74383 Transcript_38758/m.74383 type:complete len:211 (+) Transcript_38758:87-719(+)
MLAAPLLALQKFLLAVVAGFSCCNAFSAPMQEGWSLASITFTAACLLTSGNAATSAPHPNSCTPSKPLEKWGPCVYGYQCASKFCCPRLKVCLETGCGDVVTNIDLNRVTGNNKDVVDIVLFNGPTCKNAVGNKCLQDSNGQPLSAWDQSACGCDSKYMKHYTDCTWVGLNSGITCTCDGKGSKAVIGGARRLPPALGVLAALFSVVLGF